MFNPCATQAIASAELPLENSISRRSFIYAPVGEYSDRKGKKYLYSEAERQKDLNHCKISADRYQELLQAGYAEEHARGILPFDYRQHFVVSFTLRAFPAFYGSTRQARCPAGNP
jgi:thymidylate synthase ThyX